MSRREARDFRSLERRSMYSIFRPLDSTEPPARDIQRKGVYPFPHLRIQNETAWRDNIGLLSPPVLLVVLVVDEWLQAPAMLRFASVGAVTVTFLFVDWLTHRRT